MANADVDRLTKVLYHTSLKHIDKDVWIDRYFGILTEMTINLVDILNNYDKDKIKYDRREDIDYQIRKKFWERPFEDEWDTDVQTMAIQMAQLLLFKHLTKEDKRKYYSEKERKIKKHYR